MGDVTDAGQWLGPLKCLGRGRQPRINLSHDERHVLAGKFGETFLDLERDAGVMRWTEVPSVLDALNLPGAEKSQVDRDAHELSGGQRRGFRSQKRAHE